MAMTRSALGTAVPALSPSEAFRQLHDDRLLGFALLVTLGDRRRASRLTSRALAAGANRAEELGHPDRGAAWLRRRILRAVRHERDGRGPEQGRRAALAALGVDHATFQALAQLRPVERAALVAGYVERIAALDVELILDAGPSEVRRQLLDSRRRFLQRHPFVGAAAAGGATVAGHGPLATRIASIADRALSRPRP
jgi:hypothetical protein